VTKTKTFEIELNTEFQQALDLMENTNRNIFITGRAGTGKSTLLNYFRSITKKNIAVLAPTGVAAINVQGQTIHSFFKFKPDVTLTKIKKIVKDDKKNIYKKIDAIVIDEISMVRADLMDCVDKFLRLNRGIKKVPFGGLQMIFIGDLYQLPPVITGRERDIFKSQYESGYFFSAAVFKDLAMEFIELEKIYRQKDEKFINLLNNIRNNTVKEEDLFLLNQKLNPEFKPKLNDFYICLTPTNELSRQMNEERMAGLPGRTYHYQGCLEGKFDNKQLPTDVDLSLKKNSQVMLLNNDSMGRWVNGSIGKVVGIKKDDEKEIDVVLVELANGEIEEVKPYAWTIFKYHYNDKINSLESEEVGSFTQYPLKLAWSVTIHKSQGKTFDNVVIDIGRGTFAHGQMYVALSRCTSLEGLVLKKKILKKHIFIDWRVIDFVTKYQYKLSEERLPLEKKVEIIKEAIERDAKLEIIYLKAKDEKSTRTIMPRYVGEMEYSGRTYLGMEAFCLARQDTRVFRVDRILEIREID
jgi:ATP-dependent exoDNAse (exonuclease V) alpha subunit